MSETVSASALHLRKQWLHEVLFWAHAGIILGGVFMGLVLPFPIVIFLVAAHRLHLYVFDGCVVSRLQTQTDGLDAGDTFLQDMARRLWQVELSAFQSKIFDYFLTLSSIVIGYMVYAGHSRAVQYILLSTLAVAGVHACLRLLGQSRNQAPGTCPVNGDCGSVKDSDFSSIKGVPVEYIGALYFVSLFMLEVLSLALPGMSLPVYVQIGLIISGLMGSIFFIVIQLNFLKKLCMLCMNVHGYSLFIAGFGVYRFINIL